MRDRLRGLRISSSILFLCIYIFGFSLWEASAEYQLQLTSRYAGRLEFLTNLGLILTICTTTCSLLADLLHTKKHLHFLQLHNFFLGLSFPIESVIFLLYWSIRAYDRELVSSREMLSRGLQMPLFTDLALHFVPAIGLYLDLFVFAKSFVASRAHVFSLVAFNNAYMIWCHILYRMNKSWAYPLLSVLSERQHIILVMFATSLGLIFYYFGKHAKVVALDRLC